MKKPESMVNSLKSRKWYLKEIQSIVIQQIKKILVAEDVESNFILLKNLIGREYTLLWAKDGVEAIEMYKQYQPDLILMDVKMPRMDGLEATHIIPLLF